MKRFLAIFILLCSFFLSNQPAQAVCGTIISRNPLICSADNADFGGVACGTEELGANCCQQISECATQPDVIPEILVTGPTNAVFDAVNPLKLFSPFSEGLSTPGGIMSRVLYFAFPIAGMILFVMIIWGGFEILAGAQDKKSLDSGKNRVTAAIAGFMLLFSSYWIAQIIEYIFGISII